MPKAFVSGCLGLLLGAAAVYVLTIRTSVHPLDTLIVRTISDEPTLSMAEQDAHRAEGFTRIQSIEDVVALPSEFARLEALYVIAGRAGEDELQRLLFDANRLDSEPTRVAALTVLFRRFAEIDPPSALALARTGQFAALKTLEETVWAVWSRADLNGALAYAQSLPTQTSRNVAAQSLYFANGFLGNAVTDRIEAELGIAPNRRVRGRFLYRLADQSPAEAIAYIYSLQNPYEQYELVSWLGAYLAATDPDMALQYASRLPNARHRQAFETVTRRAAARRDPETTLATLAGPRFDNTIRTELYYALSALASQDLDGAMQFRDALPVGEKRTYASSIIAGVMATEDPDRALQWARENPSSGSAFRSTEFAVLQVIARTDPERAIIEAQAMLTGTNRQHITSMLINTVAMNDAEKSVALLDLIEHPNTRQQAASRIVDQWLQRDPQAVINWIRSLDEAESAELLRSSRGDIVRADLDAAVRLMNGLDAAEQPAWRRDIAQQIATTRSTTEALDFIQQYAGESDFAGLQSALVLGLAETDLPSARQLADQFADPAARDAAYAQLIPRKAQTDPRAATQWLKSIGDDAIATAATGSLVQTWYQSDPEGAEAWVQALANGEQRDSAVAALASSWRSPTERQLGMLAEIANPTRRSQAYLAAITRIAYNDPARARVLLERLPMAATTRDSVRQRLVQMGRNF